MAVAKRIDKYALGLTLAFAAASYLIPVHFFPFTSLFNEIAASIALVFLLVLIAAQGIPLRLDGAAIFVALVSLVPVVQYFSGVIFFGGDAILAVIYLLGFSLSIAAGFSLASKDISSVLNSFAGLILFTSIASSGIAIFQWLELASGYGAFIHDIGYGRAVGNIGQSNHLGTLLFMGIVCAIYFWESKKLSILVTLLTIGFLILGIVASGSRTPWLIAAATIAWLVIKINLRPENWRLCGIFCASVGFYLLALFWLFPAVAEMLMLEKSGLARSVEVGVRGLFWQQYINAAFSDHWLGYGWNQGGVAQVDVATKFAKSKFSDRSHNQILDLLVWNGPVIGVLIVVTIFYWAFRNFIACRTREHFYLLWLIGCLLVHSLLEYPLEFAYFLLPLGFLLGAADCNANFKSRVFPRGKGPYTILVLVVILCIGIVFEDFHIAEEENRKMRFRAAGIVGVEPMPDPSGIILLTQTEAFIRFAETYATENMSDTALEQMRKVATRNAYPPSLFRYALALGLNHRYQESQRMLAVLQKLHPEDIYAEAVNNWKIMANRYPQLANVKPPPVDYSKCKYPDCRPERN